MTNKETNTIQGYGEDIFHDDEATGMHTDAVSSLYISGWKLHIITFWLLLSLFVAQMDSSITSTTILQIIDRLGDYQRSPWVFTAYMLTYCGFQMIWAKVSDIITRRTTIIMSLVIFTVFSGACAASQTLLQLIMFRWAQGIGGCGIFALTQLIFFELVPPQKWPLYLGLFSAIVALSMVAGPLIGGAIAEQHQWRWIFLLNVPLCSVSIIGIIVMFPAKLASEPATEGTNFLSKDSLKRIDLLGATLLLGACVLLTTGLQQAAMGGHWTSAVVLPLLLVGAMFIPAFLVWEWYITRTGEPEPVFPWRFCRSRISIGMLLNTFFSGAVLMICLVQIPQRFVTVNGFSPLQAAIRLLAFGALVPGGSSLAASLMGRSKVPPAFMILAGACLQLIGAVLLSRISKSFQLDQTQYVFEILLGLGLGFVVAGLGLLVPFAVERRDLAVGTASISQFRILGGLIGIAVATLLSTQYLRNHLDEVLPPHLAALVLHKPENMNIMPYTDFESARFVFGEGYKLQMNLVVGFAAAQLPATALMWTSKVVDTNM